MSLCCSSVPLHCSLLFSFSFWVTPGYAQGLLLALHSGDHMECWDSNPGWPHARQTPYPLCYCSSPCIISFNMNSDLARSSILLGMFILSNMLGMSNILFWPIEFHFAICFGFFWSHPAMVRDLSLLFFLFGPHPAVYRGHSWLCTQESLLAVLGDHMGCWESNPGWPRARQTPYPLCYHSSPWAHF